jgi:hypothetical protein
LFYCILCFVGNIYIGVLCFLIFLIVFYFVSVYVNMAHFFSPVFYYYFHADSTVIMFSRFFWKCVWVCISCYWELILWCLSTPFACFSKGYVCNLSIRYLIPASLCWFGWHEVLWIRMSVDVCFLYIVKSNLLCFWCMVRSR